MYQPLIKIHPHPAIITQVLCIFVLNVISQQSINFTQYEKNYFTSFLFTINLYHSIL
jgi:hypothetical protein